MIGKTSATLLGTLILLTAFFLPRPLLALEVPPLSARVNDYAALLSPSTVSQLENSLRTFEADQATQIVVLTIPSLEGEVLEEFSIRVAEQWKIGRKGLDNGVILLIAREERKVRIEVGYGLEGRLTDLVSGRIVRDIIVPRFKQGDFNQGVIDGVSAIMAVVKGEFSADTGQKSTPAHANGEGFLIMLGVIIIFIGKALRRNRPLAAVVGGITAPLLGFFILGAKWLIIAALIPLGIVGGLIAAFLAAATGASGMGRRSSHYFGGFGGFGGSGGGGFSGGGGGFGGGGSSGGW